VEIARTALGNDMAKTTDIKPYPPSEMVDPKGEVRPRRRHLPLPRCFTCRLCLMWR